VAVSEKHNASQFFRVFEFQVVSTDYLPVAATIAARPHDYFLRPVNPKAYFSRSKTDHSWRIILMRNDKQIAHLSSAAHDFVQVARCLAAGRGRADEVSKWARSIPSSRVRDVLKTGVVPNSLTDSGALVPFRELSTGFFGSMAARKSIMPEILRGYRCEH
jgi:hypothetical protein